MPSLMGLFRPSFRFLISGDAFFTPESVTHINICQVRGEVDCPRPLSAPPSPASDCSLSPINVPSPRFLSRGRYFLYKYQFGSFGVPIQLIVHSRDEIILYYLNLFFTFLFFAESPVNRLFIGPFCNLCQFFY